MFPDPAITPKRQNIRLSKIPLGSVLSQSSGTYKNIIAAIDKKSNWFKLIRGNNTFVLDAPNSSVVEVVINSQILYEGI